MGRKMLVINDKDVVGAAVNTREGDTRNWSRKVVSPGHTGVDDACRYKYPLYRSWNDKKCNCARDVEMERRGD